jgi:hypothetical protein
MFTVAAQVAIIDNARQNFTMLINALIDTKLKRSKYLFSFNRI